MIYIEYEYYLQRLVETKRKYDALLQKKEELFEHTQPKGINTEKETVSGGTKESPFDTYLISLERIEERIVGIEGVLQKRKEMLAEIEDQLRRSVSIEDKVYRMRYLDRMRVFKIARKLNYSESNIYRILTQIQKTVKNCRKGVL